MSKAHFCLLQKIRHLGNFLCKRLLTLGSTTQNLVPRLYCTLGACPQRRAHAASRVKQIPFKELPQ